MGERCGEEEGRSLKRDQGRERGEQGERGAGTRKGGVQKGDQQVRDYGEQGKRGVGTRKPKGREEFRKGSGERNEVRKGLKTEERIEEEGRGE